MYNDININADFNLNLNSDTTISGNADFNLNLNSDTTISGNLNITGGDLTCSTANLSVINFTNANSYLMLSSTSVANAYLHIKKNGLGSSSYNVYTDLIFKKSAVTNLSTYSITFPNKSGTLALTSDIPARPEVITTYSITKQQIANLSIKSGVNYYAFGTSSSNYYTPGNIGELVSFQSTTSTSPQAFGFRLDTAFSNTRNWIIASTASFTATYITIYRPILN